MSSTSADIDRLFDTLVHPLRRQVVRILASSDADALARKTLVDALTDRVPGTEREELRTSLHHIHLPKLDAAGIIADDRNANVVRAGLRLDTADYLLTGPSNPSA